MGDDVETEATASSTTPPDPTAAVAASMAQPSRKRRRLSAERRRLLKRKVKRRRAYKRIFIALPVVVVAVVLLFLLSLWLRLDDFDKIPNAFPDGPRPEAQAGETFLLLGLDFRTAEQTTGSNATEESFVPGGQRADTIMLVHVTQDRSSAYGVSIPRDSYVKIPGYGKDKINAAFSYGGPSLMVQTVEDLTKVRIDHVAVVDWPGFRNVTDALGGVDIYFPEDVVLPGGIPMQQGLQRLDGVQALAYVRQRYDLANGDLDRVKRQQNYLRSLFTKAIQRSTLVNPVRVSNVLAKVTQNVSVDETLGRDELFDLAYSLRDLRPQNLRFYTVPIDGFGTAGAASIVLYDFERAANLWRAFRNENVALLEDRFRDRSLGVEVQ